MKTEGEVVKDGKETGVGRGNGIETGREWNRNGMGRRRKKGTDMEGEGCWTRKRSKLKWDRKDITKREGGMEREEKDEAV